MTTIIIKMQNPMEIKVVHHLEKMKAGELAQNEKIELAIKNLQNEHGERYPREVWEQQEIENNNDNEE